MGQKGNIDEGSSTRMETEYNGQFAFQDPLTTLQTLWRYPEVYVSCSVLIDRGALTGHLARCMHMFMHMFSHGTALTDSPIASPTLISSARRHKTS